MNWKVLAIVLIALIVLENLFLGYGLWLIDKEEKETNQCYYNICEGYPDAYYEIETSVCSCYDYDILGELIVSKQEWLE